MKGKNSLQFDDRGKTDKFFRAVHCSVLSKYNIDDLDISREATVKVVISYPSGEVLVFNIIAKRASDVIKI